MTATVTRKNAVRPLRTAGRKKKRHFPDAGCISPIRRTPNMKKAWILTAALACCAATTVFADTYNKKTKVTFSGPVQIPSPHSKSGVVPLPPGTYVFKLQDSSSQRHIVTVTDLRETKVISTILAIP